MLDILQHVFATPYIFPSLGVVVAIAMFVSPVLYNGDYRLATKTLVVLSGYFVFVAFLTYCHLSVKEQLPFDIWGQPVLLHLTVAISYAIGLFAGVSIHRKIHSR